MAYKLIRLATGKSREMTKFGMRLGRRLKESFIGRQILLESGSVSRDHATISVHDDGTITIRDSGSRNGTFLNGKRLDDGETASLNPSDPRDRNVLLSIANDPELCFLLSASESTGGPTSEDNIGLLVGSISDLRGTANNLVRMAKEFNSRGVRLHVILEDEVSKSSVEQALIAISSRAKDTGFFLFYYSGHGSDGSLALKPTYLPISTLFRLINGATTPNKLVVLDACKVQRAVDRGVEVPPGALLVYGHDEDDFAYQAHASMCVSGFASDEKVELSRQGLVTATLLRYLQGNPEALSLEPSVTTNAFAPDDEIDPYAGGVFNRSPGIDVPLNAYDRLRELNTKRGLKNESIEVVGSKVDVPARNEPDTSKQEPRSASA